MARLKPPRATNLLNLEWVVEDMGEVRVGTATLEIARTIDETWSLRRGADDIHRAWNWTEIVPTMREAFVVTVNEAPLAIWCSKLGSPIELAGEQYYRLDYLEIDPNRRGDGQTSTLLLGLIAKRAAEHGAPGVVLVAFDIDGLVNAYVYLGADRGAPRGWKHPTELVPLTFRQPALNRLRELIDGLEKKPPRTLP